MNKTKPKSDTDEKYVLDLCDKQNNIIRDTAFDERVVRKKLAYIS